MSHHTQFDRMVASQKRDAVQSELLTGFLEKLKATKKPDGASLFDHTVLTYCSNIRTISRQLADADRRWRSEAQARPASCAAKENSAGQLVADAYQQPRYQG